MMKIIFITYCLFVISGFAQGAKIQGGAIVKLTSSKIKISGSLNIESSSLTQTGSSTLSLDANWTNSGTFTPNNSDVYMTGANSQTITNTSGETFNNLTLSKSSGTVILPTSSTISVSGTLDFASSGLTTIHARNSGLVRVSGNVSRNGLGHVDGALAMYFSGGDDGNATFTIGNGQSYTPVEIDINGTGGTAGYLQATSNNRTLDLLGSQLDSDLNVEREYEIMPTSSNSYTLGASQTYNMVIHYLNPDDIRGGANSNTFETALYEGSAWASSLRPVGNRTNSSVESLANKKFGTYVVGPEDYFIVLYSTNSGSYSSAGSWSLYGYGDARTSPFAPRNRDIIFIGDDDIITLNADVSKLAQRTITVEKAGPTNKSGTLLMGNNLISGSGTFNLLTEGVLGIGHAEGITSAPTNAGNIRLFERNYNLGNHDQGHFIYTSASSATTGNGLPATMLNLGVVSSNELLLDQNITVTNDVAISSGTFNLDDRIITGTGSGTFYMLNSSRLKIGDINDLSVSAPTFGDYQWNIDSETEFDGSTQTVSNLPGNFPSSGYGYLILNNAGTKTADAAMIVRKDMLILGGAYFLTGVGVDQVQVYGNINSKNSGLVNKGKVTIGQ
jgi:hypothetical protein